MSELKDKTILITGATGGLGREMIKQFLAEGSSLILSDIKKESMEEIKNNLPESMQKKILLIVESDLTGKEGCKSLYDSVKSAGITTDILINNAGLASIGPFITTPEEAWEKQFAVNLLAPVRLTKLFLKDMSERNSGHIVMIASVASFIAAPGLSTYASTKFGLRAFGEALSTELANTKLKVTNLYPFFTKTPMMDSPQFGFTEKKSLPDFIMSTPEDVIRELVIGIKKDDLHVFPGLMSKTAEFLHRFAPGNLGLLFNYIK